MMTTNACTGVGPDPSFDFNYIDCTNQKACNATKGCWDNKILPTKPADAMRVNQCFSVSTDGLTLTLETDTSLCKGKDMPVYMFATPVTTATVPAPTSPCPPHASALQHAPVCVFESTANAFSDVFTDVQKPCDSCTDCVQTYAIGTTVFAFA